MAEATLGLLTMTNPKSGKRKKISTDVAAYIDWVPFSKFDTHGIFRQKSLSWRAGEWERLVKDPATWGQRGPWGAGVVRSLVAAQVI